MKVIGSAKYLISMFGKDNTTWQQITLPNTEVNDKFYVHTFVNYQPPFVWALIIAADDSIPNEHSSLATRRANMVDSVWPYETLSKSKVNWMIRVQGTFEASK